MVKMPLAADVTRMVRPWSSRRMVAVLFLFLCLTIVMTWPVAANLGHRVPGGREDQWIHFWTFDWILDSTVEGRNPFSTGRIFFPDGASLTSHNIAWVNILLWVPLQAVLGSSAAYSVHFIIIITLNGFAMYLLARELTGSEVGGIVAGLVFGFWPHVLSQPDHPNLIFTCWVPLSLLYLRRSLSKRCLRDAVIAGGFIALIGITRWQLLIVAAPAVAIMLVSLLWQLGNRTWWSIRLLIVSGCVAGLLMMPLAYPVVVAQLTRDNSTDLQLDEQGWGQTDLLAYLVPGANHPWWGDAVQPYSANFVVNKAYVPFLGYSVLLVGILGVVYRWRSTGLWLLMAGVYVLLALGPVLRVNGVTFPSLPMPYRLIEDLFLVRLLRKPDRFNILLSIPVGMLAGYGAVVLNGRRRPWQKWVLTILLGGVVLFEYLQVPLATSSVEIPDWFHQLAREKEDFAILDLPTGLTSQNKVYMHYQTVHGKPLVEGHISRQPREVFDFSTSTPFLSSLIAKTAADCSIDMDVQDVSNQLRPLAEAGVKYVVIHKTFATPEQLENWSRWFAFQPAHEDDELLVFFTDPQPGRDYVIEEKMWDGIGLAAVSLSPEGPAPGSMVEVEIVWVSESIPTGDYQGCLNLLDSDQRVVSSICEPIAPEWPTTNWDTGELVRDSLTFYIDPFIVGGDHALSLSLQESGSRMPAGEPVVLDAVGIVPLVRDFSEPSPSMPLSARYGDVLQLIGYDMAITNGDLEIVLHWQALSRMDVGYKVFVHVTNPDTGQIEAQSDFVPRNWSYPTTWWEAGEYVQDSVTLQVGHVPAGASLVTLGVYDQASGERLTVSSLERQVVGETALVLGQLE